MIQQAIAKAIEGISLDETEAMESMNEIMVGQATPAQIGAFLTAFRLKGETIDEITGFARVMRAKVTQIDCRAYPIVDTCGTGGDGKNTFNISTAAAFVAAAGGAFIAKHGGRASSSRAGSADVLTALGVNIETSPETISACIDEIGIGFMFAPLLHSAMRFASGPRREIGIRTVLNLLGPLTNPAGTTAQVMGVYSSGIVQTAAHVLKNLGTERAFVVHSNDGLDEITTTSTTQVAEVKDNKVMNYELAPENLGLPRASIEDLKGGEAADNAKIIRSILSGAQGPRRDIVLLNSAAALIAAGMASDFEEGITLAAKAIDSGAAQEKLVALIRMTNAS
tara:strand:+ start:457 stop:1470 length:1014 start_codon:yes stop_codon:yes gene_type:complete